jgi:hypothetical protein
MPIAVLFNLGLVSQRFPEEFFQLYFIVAVASLNPHFIPEVKSLSLMVNPQCAKHLR